MFNDEVCRSTTDKHTNTQTNKKHTYGVKSDETFFYRQVFYFIFYYSFCNSYFILCTHMLQDEPE